MIFRFLPCAYIDPGTGMVVLTSVWGTVLIIFAAIASFFLSYFIRPIKRFILSTLRRIRVRKVAIPLIITLAFLLGFIAGVKYDKTSEAKEDMYNKVLILGIDGMDPKMSKNLMDQGKLPNFKKLSEQGSFLNLSTSFPPHSPVAWTSIATGTNPGKHNIFDFIRRDKNTYMPELSLAKSVSGIGGTDYEPYVKAEPFWRITSKENIPTTVIRWPVSFPPERVEGNLLSGLGVPDIKGFLSGYKYYTNKELNDGAGKDKIVKIDIKDNKIESFISGPKVKQKGDIIDIKTPMNIEILDDSIKVLVGGSEYTVKEKEWSDWIKVKFKIGFLRSVDGIFKIYLNSKGPEFGLYTTTIQIDPEDPFVDISYPKSYSKDLAEEIGLYYTLGMPEETDGIVDGRLDEQSFIEQCGEIESERDKMFWKEFENFKKTEKGVFAFVYDTSDRVQHIFWDNKMLFNVDENYLINETVENYLVEKDKLLGKILDQIDESTALIIVSDHGFTSFERAVSINTWLWKNGFMELDDEPSNENAGELFKFVDMENTKAYSVGFNGIYLNLKGREGKGFVDKDDKEKVIDEIVNKLQELKDPKNDQMVFSNVYKAKEIYSGDYTDEGPDIILGFNPGYRMSWQTAVGGFTPEIIMDNTKTWDGDHLVDPIHVPGVLFTNLKINRRQVKQVDIAPTILTLMGIEIPNNFDGESLV